MTLPGKDRTYTYADYLLWSEEERMEIIDGVPYLQATPSRLHQEILSVLHRWEKMQSISSPFSCGTKSRTRESEGRG